MTDLEIGLTLALAIFFVAIGVMFVVWFHQNRSMTEENKKLRQSLNTVKSAYVRLKQQNEISEIRHKAEMNRTLYMWREETDELRCRLAQKERLLQQKWAVAKDAVSD